MATKAFKFVPKSTYASIYDLPQLMPLLDFMCNNKNICVLTGAGISTESNIPDYRSPGIGSYSKGHVPTTFQKFMASQENRQRYYARNMFGYELFNSVHPNRVHRTLKEMDHVISEIITQNVDGLHQRAGSERVLELHGTNHEIICVNCHTVEPRISYQKRLVNENLNFYKEMHQQIREKSELHRSDGDVDITKITDDKYDIVVPGCHVCGGIVKPNVIFFGENMPRERRDASEAKVAESDALLVLGSSLQVYSSYRLVLLAKKLNLPIAIISLGETRADSLEGILKVEHNVGDVLEHIISVIPNDKL